MDLLHTLVDIRAIEDLNGLDGLVENGQVLDVAIVAIVIPDLNDVEPLLGTDADSNDSVLYRSLRDRVQSGGRNIPLEHLEGLGLAHLDTVGATTDVHVVLPEGRVGITHEEPHPIIELLYTNRTDRGPQRSVVGE